jgi:gamma-glutamyl-gamma-aminobutyrate hydrolase PuuD
MNKILLTPRLEKIEGYGEIRDELDIEWAKIISECGFLPVICPTFSDRHAYLDDGAVAGVLLTGGNDLFSVSGDEVSKMRDEAEKALVAYAIERGVPVLGVCRGMQFLIEYFGGKLELVDHHVRVEHEITFCGETRFFGKYGKTMNVNSFHSYRPPGVARDIVPVAHSSDGSLEAFEHRILPVAAMMWHPERVRPFASQDKEFLKGFFSQRKKNI